MNIIALVLMIVFLSISVALYLAGILVVNRVDLAVHLDHQVEQYYNWVMQNGSPTQKQAARQAVQNRDLDQLKTLVGIDPMTT